MDHDIKAVYLIYMLINIRKLKVIAYDIPT